MTVEVASRELRNNTAELLRLVDSGQEVVITRRGKPVATLIPVRQKTKRWIPKRELLRRLRQIQADPGPRADLERLAGETTDGLGPIQ